MLKKRKASAQRISPYEQRFLLEYFKEMRSEINLRINNHSNLVWAKVITTGALMSFLIAQSIDSKVRLYGFAFIPIISILYDVMIAQNVKSIHRIGLFIRDNIEDVLFPDRTLWEKYGGQRDSQDRNYGPVDIFLLSLFTFGTMVVSIFLTWNAGYPNLAILTGIVFLVSFVLLVQFMSQYILFFKK
jgi:hypothetical protein